MQETVRVDKKGRLVLPKKIREGARIPVDTKLVVRVSSLGSVELSDPRILTATAQEIGARKLAGWREGDHEATANLFGPMKVKNEAS